MPQSGESRTLRVAIAESRDPAIAALNDKEKRGLCIFLLVQIPRFRLSPAGGGKHLLEHAPRHRHLRMHMHVHLPSSVRADKLLNRAAMGLDLPPVAPKRPHEPLDCEVAELAPNGLWPGHTSPSFVAAHWADRNSQQFAATIRPCGLRVLAFSVHRPADLSIHTRSPAPWNPP